MRFKISIVLCSFIFLTGYSCVKGKKENSVEFIKSLKIDTKRIFKTATAISAAPHPFGSNQQIKVAKYIKTEVDKNYYDTKLLPFSSETPNPRVTPLSVMFSSKITKNGQNILSLPRKPTKKCIYLIGSHYDSKWIENKNIVGANDSGSSSAGLIELSHIISKNPRLQNLSCNIGLIWFDGEESILENWNDGLKHPSKITDNTYGSRKFTNSLIMCKNNNYCLTHNNTQLQIKNLYLIDMIGGKDIIYSNDLNSDNNLKKLFYESLKDFSLLRKFSNHPKNIQDDHIPFVNLSIPSLNIIGFEDLRHWHLETDTIKNLSIDSVETSLRILLLTILKSEDTDR